MPKSAKKRKDKAADFSKAKLKLGKGKQLPSNAIDTSFKARSIALPTQSIALEKDGAVPTTKRSLTFDDLVAHLKHYSAGTRKDAIVGLRELFEAHSELIDSSLTPLFNASVRIIGDEDASVRKALLAFLSWLLPQIPPDRLIPHTPLLLLFTTSAQTHIFPEIRIDAIRFLDLLIKSIPETVVAGWNGGGGEHGSRVLEGYLGILNAGTKFGESEGPVRATSTASVVLSPASKLIVLKSLSRFLQKAVSSPYRTASHTSWNLTANPIPTWYLVSSFASPEDYESFDRLFQPIYSSQTSTSHRVWKAEVEPEIGDEDFVSHHCLASAPFESRWTLQHLSDVVNATGCLTGLSSSNVTESSFIAHLARTLHSTLISTFLDCAPQVFSPSLNPPEIEVQLVVAVAEIARSLYSDILQDSTSGRRDSAAEELRALLGYMSTYFPFGRNLGNRDIKLEQAFQDLNIIHCELTSLLVLASREFPSSHPRTSRAKARHHVGSQKSEAALSLQTERVCEYIVQLLRGEATMSSQLPRPLTAVAYIALLPAIWSLLNDPSTHLSQSSSRVLLAVVEHSTKAASNSATKRPSTEFVARLALLETQIQYRGVFKVGRTHDEEQKFEEWIKHLPKVLWELGSNNLSTTETILRFLLRLFQRKSCLVQNETITSVRSRLIPYFSITHAVRGQLPGPYAKLPPSSSIRRLALDVVATVNSLRLAHDNSLIDAVDRTTAGTEECAYWEHVKAL